MSMSKCMTDAQGLARAYVTPRVARELGTLYVQIDVCKQGCYVYDIECSVHACYPRFVRAVAYIVDIKI